MTHKTFSLVAGLIFGLMAVLHVLRILFRWQVILEGRTLPLWGSWLPIVFFAYLAYEGFRLSKKSL